MLQGLRHDAWYVGHLAGVPLYVHWSVLLLVLLVMSGGGGAERIILILLALVIGIVLHELGHALMARWCGASGITITLWAFGGLCESRRDVERIGRELAIVAAGPAVSLALWLGCSALLAWLQAHHPHLVSDGYRLSLLAHALAVGAAVNMSLFIFNMLPIFPMDGGQLVYYGAIGVTGNRSLARQISLFLAVIGACAFFGWRTDLWAMLAAGESWTAWAAQLSWSDAFLALLLLWILRSAFAYLS
ncbi:MAG: site-2 protease family protein [Planctomycetota bacterium]|nr:site-2 protease family protein [Planctomycetota bacterium]MCX8039330.1 site-2 protease family protein [Planctomycetota bacterium]MDW8372096.1 site-2 protease family protein [Planctomycetota bacterium]